MTRYLHEHELQQDLVDARLGLFQGLVQLLQASIRSKSYLSEICKHKIMVAWIVRAGRNGEDEQLALEQDLVCIRWIIPNDLSKVTDKNRLYTYAKEEEPFASEGHLFDSVGQLSSFVHRIEKGDFIILPRKRTLKTTRTIAVGRASAYQYRSDLMSLKGDISLYHTRGVKWLTKDLPRNELSDDTLRSINLPRTVFRINQSAEEAIIALMRKRGEL